MNFLKVIPEKLSVDTVTDLVSSESCGAISIFIGTTRDSFEDKEVETLEYEAYESMAIKYMEKICDNVRTQWPDVVNIAIFHRLGLVPVKEASIIIATSSPHRSDAIKATEFCLENVKKSVPIWKKEYYKGGSEPQWKENLESRYKHRKYEIKQEVQPPVVHPYLVLIKATKQQLENDRIMKCNESKREAIDVNNVREFCVANREAEYSCARVDAMVIKRKDSKSHLQINRVINSYQHRDQTNADYMKKHIPQNGVDERLKNLEEQLSLAAPVPMNIYKRLEILENRLLQLEALSPEYIQFWDKMGTGKVTSHRKKIWSIEEIDDLIAETEKSIASD